MRKNCLWTSFAEFVIVRSMMHKISFLFVFVSLAAVMPGCQNCSTNHWAQNAQTVPPPGTFSSQASYLGQTPGTYIPLTPATTFPTASPEHPVSGAAGDMASPPATPPAAPLTEQRSDDWTPAATTSQTAFQAMDAKTQSPGSTWSEATPETVIVGSTHTMTTITEDVSAEPPLTEPSLLLYHGAP